MRTFRSIVLTVFLSLSAATAAAQAPAFALEVRGGLAAPLGEFSSSEQGLGARLGTGYEWNGVLRAYGGLFVYGGYGRDWFSCGAGCRLYGSGLSFGLRAESPDLLPARGRVWARAGLLVQRLEAVIDAGASTRRTADRAAGTEIGAGIALEPVDGLRFTPGFRFRRHPARLDPEIYGPGGTARVRYLSLDLGAQLVVR